MTTNFGGVDMVPLLFGGVDVVPLLGAMQCSLLRFGGWGSGRWTLLGAIAGRHCSVLWLAEAFFLYIDNAKIGFCAIWGLCWYNFCVFLPRINLAAMG